MGLLQLLELDGHVRSWVTSSHALANGILIQMLWHHAEPSAKFVVDLQHLASSPHKYLY